MYRHFNVSKEAISRISSQQCYAYYSANALTISAGVAVTSSTGSTLNVKGAIINNGSIIGDGDLVLNGASNQVIKGTGNTITLR